jgi:hypothetical protein
MALGPLGDVVDKVTGVTDGIADVSVDAPLVQRDPGLNVDLVGQRHGSSATCACVKRNIRRLRTSRVSPDQAASAESLNESITHLITMQLAKMTDLCQNS